MKYNTYLVEMKNGEKQLVKGFTFIHALEESSLTWGDMNNMSSYYRVD